MLITKKKENPFETLG